jgi:hypothetical protein
MPQVPEEYCRTHPAKYNNSGTGVFTDLSTDALQVLTLVAAIQSLEAAAT